MKGTKQGGFIHPEATMEKPFIGHFGFDHPYEDALLKYKASIQPIPHYGAFGHLPDGSVVEYELGQRTEVLSVDGGLCNSKDLIAAVPVKGKVESRPSQSDAVEFLEWVDNNYWIREPFPRESEEVPKWVIYDDFKNGDDNKTYTTTELYKLFLKSK